MSERTEFTLPDGHTLYRWRDGDGVEWACCAYDHGPFCRRCKQVDEILTALLDNVEAGLATVRDEDRRGMVFKLTPAGTARAEALLSVLGEDLGA